MLRFFYQLILVGFCSALFGYSINTFLIPHDLASGGVTGIAFLIHHFLDVNTGIIVLLINIPLFILAIIYLGKRFVFFTIFSVSVVSLSLRIIPIQALSDDILLSSIIGGALNGIAVGLVIRMGGSTGGTDIVSLILSQKKDLQVGFLNACMNLLIVASSGFIFGWSITLYTIISIYVTGRAVDMVYTTQNKLTLMIVTEKGEELAEALLHLNSRGVTMHHAEGCYTNNPKKILTTVITRFELNETKHVIKKTDPDAFVNITQTLEVMGRFRRN